MKTTSLFHFKRQTFIMEFPINTRPPTAPPVTKKDCFKKHITLNQKQLIQLYHNLRHDLLCHDEIFSPIQSFSQTIKHNDVIEVTNIMSYIKNSLPPLFSYIEMACGMNLESDLTKPLQDLYTSNELLVAHPLDNQLIQRKCPLLFTICLTCLRFHEVGRLFNIACYNMAHELMLDGSLSYNHIYHCWKNYVLCSHCPLGGNILTHTLVKYCPEKYHFSKYFTI